jgi:hypothetical protein
VNWKKLLPEKIRTNCSKYNSLADLKAGLPAMHTLNLTYNLLTLAVLGVLATAIITSSLEVKRVSYGNRSAAGATMDLSSVQTSVQGQYASAWQRLKIKSEAQIRDNDMRISKFKAQRLRAGRTFQATYDRRVAELERRNIALKTKLNDYSGYRGVTLAESK